LGFAPGGGRGKNAGPGLRVEKRKRGGVIGEKGILVGDETGVHAVEEPWKKGGRVKKKKKGGRGTRFVQRKNKNRDKRGKKRGQSNSKTRKVK